MTTEFAATAVAVIGAIAGIIASGSICQIAFAFASEES